MRVMLDEAETKRKADEEEAMNNHPLLGLFGGIRVSQHTGTPGKRPNNVDKFANALRMSLASANAGADYDMRPDSFLAAMRKLFEEVRRADDIPALNAEPMFGPELRSFAGDVHKDDFIYVVLDREQLTIARSEAANIVELMSNIGGAPSGQPTASKGGGVNVDELQYSFTSYLKYCELIEARVIDLLEKIKLAVGKRLEFNNDRLD